MVVPSSMRCPAGPLLRLELLSLAHQVCHRRSPASLLPAYDLCFDPAPVLSEDEDEPASSSHVDQITRSRAPLPRQVAWATSSRLWTASRAGLVALLTAFLFNGWAEPLWLK
ncbi:hypothetical protein TRIUR3_34905 [Triticum urartu]|uniref:Uncharacterized protein n=1 Tax=Triticum urartu TaxID=4572 RepID=M7ZTB0_TRIUA|nr:hypothetical protein TRIUR3_34905 [Triticum urartu]